MEVPMQVLNEAQAQNIAEALVSQQGDRLLGFDDMYGKKYIYNVLPKEARSVDDCIGLPTLVLVSADGSARYATPSEQERYVTGKLV
jgi:hypothetical protein